MAKNKNEVVENALVDAETVITEDTTQVTESAPQVIQFKFTCPHCEKEVIIEKPAPARRGKLSGVVLEEMTDAQLKIEKINSYSVWSKAKTRGADVAIIQRNLDRLDAVKAEIAKRAAANAPVVVVDASVTVPEIAAEV